MRVWFSAEEATALLASGYRIIEVEALLPQVLDPEVLFVWERVINRRILSFEDVYGGEEQSMIFTAPQVIRLRDQTGCSLMDCKNALKWADGDWDYAVRILKSMSLAIVQKPYLWKVAKEEYEQRVKE